MKSDVFFLIVQIFVVQHLFRFISYFLFQVLKWLASCFSCWSGHWQVSPSLTGPYPAHSYLLACIAIAQLRFPRLLTSNELSVQHIYEDIFIHFYFYPYFIHCTCLSHFSLHCSSIMNIGGCPHLSSTIMFVDLLLQDIQSSFLRVCIRNIFNLHS